MKQEQSAGAVIIRNLSNTWEVLLIRDMKGILTFPKGFMELGEEAKQTAKREATEETGITNITLLSDLPKVSYFYTRDGQSIKKQVQYFLFLSDKEEHLTPQIEEGITEIVWMHMDKALALIGYEKSNKPVLTAANTYITETMKKKHV
ncbi:MAG: NUDIX domain-containing protein [Microgenomates group bacterium]